ncbi:BofC C-terminal domain-containing protein, partial [Anaerosinus sp.]
VNDYCEWHKNNNFIGIHEGRIAIFSGMPDNKPLLREQTMISVDQLHPQALEEIKNGLVFSSKEEMLQFLEGIQSK